MTDRSATPESDGKPEAGPRLAGEALDLLRLLTGNPAAQFRPGQLEAIERLRAAGAGPVSRSCWPTRQGGRRREG